MYNFKGIGKTAITCETDHFDRIELIRYLDGSWGVRKNAQTVGVWEPHEEDECFCVFSMLAGLDKAKDAGSSVLIVRRKTAAAAAAISCGYN
jgi:hypothetical protein